MKFHWEIREFPWNKKNKTKKIYFKKSHILPDGNSTNLDVIFWIRNYINFLSEIFSLKSNDGIKFVNVGLN